MKKLRILSAAAAAAVTLSALTALPSYAYNPFTDLSISGYETFTRSETLSQGLTLETVNGRGEDGSLLSANILRWDTSDRSVEPRLTFGEGIYGRETLTDMAEYERSVGAGVPLAGVNTDFFSMQTGVPIGCAVKDGRLVTSGPEGSAVLAVDIDGRAFMAEPQFSVVITRGDRTAEIGNLNKFPTVYGSYLLTSDFGSSTQTTEPSREIVIQTGLSGVSGFPLGSYVTGTVLYVNESATDTPITPGCAVLTVADASEASSDPLISALAVGDEVNIGVGFAGLGDLPVRLATGGGDWILKDGGYNAAAADEDHEIERRARTAAGITASGGIIFFAAEGTRAGISDGLTLAELAAVMSSLGCVDAINLDGGGSTTVAAQRENGFRAVNRPSDGAERAIGAGLIFCRAAGYTSDARMAITAEYPVVLADGGYDTFAAYLVQDDVWNPVAASDAEWSLNRNFGQIDVKNGKAVLTAAANTGHARIEASFAGVKGSLDVLCVSELSSLSVDCSADRAALDGWVDISPRGNYYGLAAGMRVTQLRFDPNYTPESNPMWRPFDVGRTRSEAREDFMYWSRFGYLLKQNDLTARYRMYNNYTYAGVDTDKINVSAGGAASSVSIALGIGRLTLGEIKNSGMKLDPGVKRLEIEVRFESVYELDGLTAAFRDAAGADLALYWESDDVMSRAGRATMHLDVPENAAQPLTLMRPVSKGLDYSGLSAVYLESASSESSAPYFSDVSDSWAKDYIEKAHLMGIADGYKTSEGTPYYNPGGHLTRAEFAKLLSAYMGLEDDDIVQLEDVKGWAAPYVRAVVSHGYMRGRGATERGSVIFAPNDKITRAEVMQVFGQLLPESASADLPYSDAKLTPSWAMVNAARCVSSGVIGGYPDGTLRPNNYVSRAEIAAMFVKLDGVI